MGAYSDMDIDLRFGSNAFEEETDPTEDPTASVPAPEQSASTNTAPSKENTAHAEKPAEDKKDEDAKRKAHEEAEAKRKAEFDAKQAAKKAAQEEQLAKVAAMSDDEVMAASMKRVSADTEKLTRRNMKECVAEYIQTKCIEDPAFARLAMHPLKSMIHCFWYINRKAREYLHEEMKMNDEQPPQGVNGVYGGDVPDDLCYSWSEEYFRDPDAEEDHRDEEKFVPKPYNGRSTVSKFTSKAKGKDKKADDKKAAEKPKVEAKSKSAPKPEIDDGQMSLLGVA